MTNELIAIPQAENPYAIMPVLDIQHAVARRQAVIDYTRRMMIDGTDYGKIPGTGDKPTLLKPGAEKLASLFGLSPLFEIVEREMDWTGDNHGGEPFFYIQYRCTLTRGEIVAGQGVGSCNSWEKKYRYRTVYPNRATAEEKERGRLETRSGKGGSSYQVYVVKNPDPADVVNTIDKMAQKRALVAAVLIAVNASELFTQDIEDYSDIIDGDWQSAQKPASKPATVAPVGRQAAKPTAKPPVTAPPSLAEAMKTPIVDQNFLKNMPAVIEPWEVGAGPKPAPPTPPGEIVGAQTAELPDYRAMAVNAKTDHEFDYAAYMTLRNGVSDSVERVAKTRRNLFPDWKPAPRSNTALLLALEVYRDKRAAAETRGEAARAAHDFAKLEALQAWNAVKE